jgi:GDP/UDP-N,N'-diacetylbacillosamine 2-epimerase (hydrolysing)
MQRITYLTGTRADFGLMRRCLDRIADTPELTVELLVTGMHLSERFGLTVGEVEESGHSIASRIAVPIDDDSGRGMGVSAGLVTSAVAEYLSAGRCDALLLLGDRGEMLAGATAALFAGIPIVHVAGGDVSGSVDDSIRHAISKISHLHCVSNQRAAERLVRMGEMPSRIFNVGAPGLVGLGRPSPQVLKEVSVRYGLGGPGSFAMLLFHPVVQEAALAGQQWRTIFEALTRHDVQCLALLPNADHGTNAIRTEIESMSNSGRLIMVDHLPREDYIALLAASRFLIGNSSSGIVEAASLATPVVNVGERQLGRLRSANVIDTSTDYNDISNAINAALCFESTGLQNVYGKGDADRRLAEVLVGTDFADPELMIKRQTI